MSTMLLRQMRCRQKLWARFLALQLELREGSTGGGSDANLVAPFGVAILDGLGPLGNGAHTRTEALRVEKFAPRVALLAAILSEWGGG